MKIQDVRRLDDGRIDLDFYRAQANAMRMQKLEAVPRLALRILMLLAVAIITVSAPEFRA